MSELICRALASGNKIEYVTERVQDGKVIGLLETEQTPNLKDIFKEDLKYGLLLPRDGKSYSYRVLNGDREITTKQVRKAVQSALLRWWIELDFSFHKAAPEEIADITIQFRSEEEDELLNPQTLAYMYYPLGGINNGVCVVNTRFHWTLDGKAVSMHDIDPVHYPDPVTAPVQGLSHDLDQVLGHEFGHGIFGLPHIHAFFRMMSANYSKMSEWLHIDDILRAAQKIPRRKWIRRRYLRMKSYIKNRSERKYS